MFTKRFGSVPHYKIVAGERERERDSDLGYHLQSCRNCGTQNYISEFYFATFYFGSIKS